MASLQSPKFTGRCQCGNITYTIASEPHSLNVCYCLECQRQSASAFGIALVVPSSAVHLSPSAQPQLGHFERKCDSGRTRGGKFCTSCGVRIYHYNPLAPKWFSIRGGTLDQKVDLSKAMHIWTKRKLEGLVIPKGVETWEEEPDDGVL